MSVEIRVGDCLDLLRALPAESVHCVVTSPPYWGLRDYGVAGQMGMEPTLGEHLEVMVAVFREVRRVLRSDGTLWLNYGDCYATSPNGRSAADTKAAGGDDRTFRDKPFSTIGGVLKPKDLCMIPNRLAIALQEDGWWVRSEIVWHKPNPMPESIRDRPATAHEKMFLLSKSARYFYDAEAVRTAASADSIARYERGRSDTHKWADGGPGNQTIAKSFDHMRAAKRASEQGDVQKPVAGWATGVGPHTAVAHNKGNRDDKQAGHGRRHDGFNERWAAKQGKAPRGSTPRHKGHIEHTNLDATPRGQGANLRNVWTIATKPFSQAHFATFPPDLVAPCIKAGCPEDGTVLDPFGGAGTTGLVADRLGRNAILLELNPDYADMARRRIEGDAGLFAEVSAAGHGGAAE